jgi:hypothetical protein
MLENLSLESWVESKKRTKVKMAIQICEFLDEQKSIIVGQLIQFTYRGTSK